tara:strand:- start:165 stop:545 length:381 start_codon:yes stop_codon:yes gene_type:complete
MIINLRVISQTPENGKLCMRGQQLYIESPLIQSFRRWIFSDSRNSTIDIVKNIIYSSMNIYIVTEDEFIKKCILNGLGGSIKGIGNLKMTYSTDVSYCAQLDLLLDEIKTFIGEKNINSEYGGDNG